LICAVLITSLFLCQKTRAQSVTLEHVDGALSPSEIIADGSTPIIFHIRLTGDADAHGGIVNGFRIYSDDGATWQPATGDTVGLGKAQFDGGFFINYFGRNGSDADTIGFGGFRFFGTGLPAGYDDTAFTIDIGPISSSNHNKTICLDSSFYPPSGVWKWAGPDVFPSWDGPHCFTCIDTTQINPEISIDSVAGLHENNDTEILADGSTEISFYIRLKNTDAARGAVSNGFRIFSDDSADWGGVTVDTISLAWDTMFDRGFYTINSNSDGTGADTVGFTGISMDSAGLPANFDERAYKITIGPLDVTNHNKTICIDSSFYSPSGVWWWSPGTAPDWSGSKCFTCIDPNTTDISGTSSGRLPGRYSLSQNYPNPFNPATSVAVICPAGLESQIRIYDIRGRIVYGKKIFGSGVVEWNAAGMPEGVYLLRAQVGEKRYSRKLILQR
jgi:hypothetical protein